MRPSRSATRSVTGRVGSRYGALMLTSFLLLRRRSVSNRFEVCRPHSTRANRRCGSEPREPGAPSSEDLAPREVARNAESVELEFSGEVWHWRGPAPFHFVWVDDD